MTKIEAKRKLKEACALIFEIEEQLTYGEFPRQHGYQARIKIGALQDAIRTAPEFTGGEY